MITKSEEESWRKLIGSKIADYLIKPVNPNQILLSLKKRTWITLRLISQNDFRLPKEFRKIGDEMAMVNSYQDWVRIST
jgi:response regulator RpfG family c-di-GMP phosphodiesterase